QLLPGIFMHNLLVVPTWPSPCLIGCHNAQNGGLSFTSLPYPRIDAGAFLAHHSTAHCSKCTCPAEFHLAKPSLCQN
ncbi:hypothetical protein BKA70DRAFT_1330772, partial [Coprinopsis sp. MPI-PUGE-AT-0042]